MNIVFICSLIWLAKGKQHWKAALHFRSNFINNSTGNLEYGYIRPLLQLSNLHKAVNISCKSFSIPEWFKGQSRIVYRRGMSISRSEPISKLTIYSTKEDDSGVYKCVGTNDNGARFEAESELIVAGKDSIS